jgi:glycosyltransferase involved in cell wall biosynthesis
MKIALSIAEMSIGGIATFVLNLSQSLGQAGHEVLVIAQRPGAWWSRLAEIGVRGYCLPRRRWDSVQQAARRFAAYLTAQQVDLLLVNIGIDNRLPMLALHLLPDALPVVLALHNDRPEVYALAAINQGRWNCAVAVSPKVQQRAVARFGQKTVLCIPNGVDLPSDTYQPAEPDWSTPLRLLFVGRLDDHQKGIFRLPAILAACRQRQLPVRLTVIGDGPDQPQLCQLFEEAGVADLVELHAFQPHEQVLAAMNSHRGLLMPSNYEGMPNVLLEAQTHGCVPIAARLPGITDYVVQDGISGFLVNPPEIEGYVNRIEQLLVPERWRALRNTGMGLIRQHFSIQSMGERYLALFTELEHGAYARSPNHFRLRPPACLRFGWSDYLPAPLVGRLRRFQGRFLNMAQQRQGIA